MERLRPSQCKVNTLCWLLYILVVHNHVTFFIDNSALESISRQLHDLSLRLPAQVTIIDLAPSNASERTRDSSYVKVSAALNIAQPIATGNSLEAFSDNVSSNRAWAHLL